MNEVQIKELISLGKRNKEFNDEILIADGDTPPTITSTLVEELLYACTYYGWLVGKYGSKDWSNHR